MRTNTLSAGTYLTDGRRLLEVVEARSGMGYVVVEDCVTFARWEAAGTDLAGYRVVRGPEGGEDD